MESEIQYVMVSCQGKVVGAHAFGDCDYQRECRKLLDSTFVQNEQRRIRHDIFSFYKTGQFSFICVSPGDGDRRTPIAYLNKLSTKWQLLCTNRVPDASITEELFISSMDEIRTAKSFGRIRDTLEETQNIALQSIDELATRGDSLEMLDGKTEELKKASSIFAQEANHLRRIQFRQYIKSYVIIAIVLLFLIYIVLVLVCGGLTLKPRCFKDSK